MLSNLAILGGNPMFDKAYVEPWPPITQEDINICITMLKNRELSYYGREGKVAELEDLVCKYHGVNYSIAVNTGTSSLHSAFFALGLGPGDEVLCPTYTFLATVMPLFQCYAKPVLCDCEMDTGNISPEDIERKLTERTRAIVVTHMWGHPCDMEKILKICREHNLYLIEDCSHAHGATYFGKKVGTFGEAGCFSFQASKIVTGGCAGIMITDDQEVYERAALLGHFRNRCFECVSSERYSKYSTTGFGLNYRMHPLAAAIAVNQFKDLDNRITKRCNNLDYLSSIIDDIGTIIKPPVTREGCTRGAYYGYKPKYFGYEDWGVPIDIYVNALRAEGLDINIPGSKPLHLLNIFQGGEKDIYSFRDNKKKLVNNYICYKKGDLPNSEIFYNHTISFPTFTYTKKEIIDMYAETIKKIDDNKDELISYARSISK